MRSHDIDLRDRTATDMHDPILQARTMVHRTVNDYLNDADKIKMEDVYIVSFAYVLGGWKALVSTTIPDDRYYEVTSRPADVTYIDVYVKERQEVVAKDDAVHNL